MADGMARPAGLVQLPPTDPAAAPRCSVVPFAPAARGPQASETLCVRLAIYRSGACPPEVYDVTAQDPGALLSELAARTLWALSLCSSPLPAEAALAIVENLIHAGFQVATVSVLADGSLRVSDRGPGIPDKERAVLPGFTTATPEMRRYIRGVGSGLAVARQLVASIGGELVLEDNLSHGTVAALLPRRPEPGSQASPTRLGLQAPPSSPGPPPRPAPLFDDPASRLTRRQALILALLGRRGPLGPSGVSRELGMSLSTAFRELTALEGMGLVWAEPGGKRTLSAEGGRLARRLDPEGRLQGA